MREQDTEPDTKPAAQEEGLPDTTLQTRTGQAGTGGMTLAALAVAVVPGVVFYGLNYPAERIVASSPGNHAMAPSGGGNSDAPKPRPAPPNVNGAKG